MFGGHDVMFAGGKNTQKGTVRYDQNRFAITGVLYGTRNVV
jgi:hypothetical protein